MTDAVVETRERLYITILFVLLVCQVVFISISIAVSSIAFGLSIVLVAYWCGTRTPMAVS